MKRPHYCDEVDPGMKKPHHCDEADSSMKMPQQSKKKKKRAKTNAAIASSKQLVVLPDNKDDSDYVPIEDSKGCGSFRRVWTEKDEIMLLEALKQQNNKSDMAELFNSVKASLEAANVSKSQLSDKVRKMRNKFKKSIVDVAHLQGHQAKVHKLCQQLWGGGQDMTRGAAESKKSMVDVAVAGNDDDEEINRIISDFIDGYPFMNSRLQDLYPFKKMTSEGYNTIRKLMMTDLSEQELKVMEKKWVDFHIEEIRVMGTKRMLLMEEQMRLIQKARQINQINKD